MRRKLDSFHERERGSTDPQLSILIKVLTPLGKTFAIVPLDQARTLKPQSKFIDLIPELIPVTDSGDYLKTTNG